MSLNLNWINLDEYSFNHFLLLERFQIQLLMEQANSETGSKTWRRNMGIALCANPAVQWYFVHRYPECRSLVKQLTEAAEPPQDRDEIRNAERFLLAQVEDFITYTTPEVMAGNCPYIRDWDRQRLYEMADLRGKFVLDVGGGSGRLTFAAAEIAKEVYVVEPVETLRAYIRQEAKKRGKQNIRVTEGLVTALPYADSSFDIVMSGHVVGDHWEEEVAELTRVCRSGGAILDCPGEEGDGQDDSVEDRWIERGWEAMSYVTKYGKKVRRYRKPVRKGA